jgi:hypothetical protein
MRFSKSTQCFYPLGINYAALPADITDVTQADFDLAMSRKTGETLDLVNGKVVIVPMQAAQLHANAKTAAWESIKSKRIVITGGGIQVGTNWFHSDESSRIQQLGLKDEARDALAIGAQATDPLMIDGSPVFWKTMSGSFVPMTVQLALDIVTAVKVLDKRAHAAAEQHRMAMEASADPAAYNYSAGWPAVFAQP